MQRYMLRCCKRLLDGGPINYSVCICLSATNTIFSITFWVIIENLSFISVELAAITEKLYDFSLNSKICFIQILSTLRLILVVSPTTPYHSPTTTVAT
jgi:hypothetical protein